MQEYFTIDKANRLIPTLKEQFTQARQELAELHERLRATQNDLLEVELAKREKVLQRAYDRAYKRLETRWQELARELETCKAEFSDSHDEWTERFDTLGIIVRDLAIGLVDFPARRNGQDIFWCWRVEEERISYWHGLSEGFRGRKPLAELGPHHA